MPIAANIAIAWPSTIASIPAGWTREAQLDSRYILGAAAGADTDLTTDRGNTTHTHTSPAHTPIQDPHTHTVDSTSGPDLTLSTGVAGVAASGTHQHTGATTSATAGTNNSVTITVDTTSNDLSFLEVIWIKSDGSPTTFPNGSIAFFMNDSIPSGWSRVGLDTYLKGAAVGTGGGATGGSNTHTHTSPAHTHTQNVHAHTVTPASGDTTSGRGVGAQVVSSTAHTHALTISGTTPTNQSVTTTITATSHEPPFFKTNIIQASSDSLPTGIVAVWLGTNAAIPTGWTRVTSLDSQWLKGCAAAGESGSTGGSSQHSHTASACQPVQNSHTHFITDGGATDTTTSDPVGINTTAANGHKHSWDVSAVVATNQSTAVTIDLCTANAALPKHRTVIFVQSSTSVVVVPPTRRSDVYTSYDLNLFDLEGIEGHVLPEVAKKMAQGDLRYVPR